MTGKGNKRKSKAASIGNKSPTKTKNGAPSETSEAKKGSHQIKKDEMQINSSSPNESANFHHEAVNNSQQPENGLPSQRTSNEQPKSEMESHGDPETIVEYVTSTLENWIKQSLSGSNISGLLKQFPELDRFEALHGDIHELYKAAEHLNLELLNMFDNYLCFAGTEDKFQFKRLSSMAATRAKTGLEAKSPKYIEMIMGLFDKISSKLCKFYEEENRQIRNYESELSGNISLEISNLYKTQMTKYLKAGARNVSDIHNQLVKYSLGLLDRMLDFSAKMNYIHTKASDMLEQNLNKNFLALKKKHEPCKIVGVEKKPKPPTQIDPTTALVLKYIELMNNTFYTQKDYKSLEILHANTVKTIATNFESFDQPQAQLVIDRYFVFTSNRFESISRNGDELGKCITIYFTESEVHFGVVPTYGQGWTSHVSLGTSLFSSLPKRLVTKAPIPKFIQALASQKPSERTKNKQLLTDVLKRVKTQAEGKAGKMTQITIIHPTWFELAELSILKEMSEKAIFKKTFFVRESFADIFAYLSSMKSPNETWVVITAHELSIFVDIYGIQNRKTIQLLGLAANKISGVNNTSASSSPVYSSINTYASLDPESGSLCSRLLQTLQETYDKAEKCLDERFQKQVKNCFFVSYSSTWTSTFDTFLERNRARLQYHKLPTQRNWNAALVALSRNVAHINDIILDYVLPVLPEDTVERNESVVSESDNSTMIEAQRENLLQKCKLIREHLNSGKVRLGVLMIKLVTQCVDQAEFVANDVEASEDEVEEQCAKIDGVIRQHKFDITV